MDNKTKIKLNIIRLLCIISLLITFLTIRNTYAKYYERLDTSYDISIKKWLIKVNNFDIMEENSLESIVTPTLAGNEYINANVLVPTAQGYFDIDVDYTDVDLSFDVDFTIEQIDDYAYSLSDLNFLKCVTVDEDVETEVSLPYTVEVTGEEEDTTIEFRIYFEWYDGEDETMSDADDTNFVGETVTGNSHTITRYRATSQFTQHTD